MSRGNAKLEVGQLVLTSSTPPGNLGLYAKDENTIGVVGDLVCIDPKSKAESSVVTSTVDPVTGGIELSAGGKRPPGIPAMNALPKLLVFGCSIAQQCNVYTSNVTSTLSAVDLKAGAVVLTVANGALFAPGQKITVPLYNARLWTTTINSIAGNDLTIADKTPGLIRASSAVTITTTPTLPNLSQGFGAVTAAVALLGGPVEVVPSYGYGGAIYRQMYADLERDLRYYSPHYVALHMFENDLTSTVAGGGATIEQFKMWARQMCRLCLNYGAIPMVYSSMPYYNSTANAGIPASRAADYDALAVYVGSGQDGQLSKDVPGAWGDNSLSYGWLDTSNPTWPRAPQAGWTDGVHPNTGKRFAVGLIALPALQQMLPAASSRLEQIVTPLEMTRCEGTGGGASNLVGGSIVPKSHTTAAYGTAVCTSSRNADGTIKLLTNWPGAADRSVDYVTEKYTFTPPACWIGSTQRFKVYVRARINAMVGIAQIFAEVTIVGSGENHTGQTGTDMCETIPADGRIMLLESPHFAIGVGATTLQPALMIRPITAGSPANAVIDMDVLELGVVPVIPEVPHAYV